MRDSALCDMKDRNIVLMIRCCVVLLLCCNIVLLIMTYKPLISVSGRNRVQYSPDIGDVHTKWFSSQVPPA